VVRETFNRDDLFLRFVAGVFGIMAIFLLSLAAALFGGADDAIVLRMLSGFASMFAGLIGLGSGYLLGSRRDNGVGRANDRPNGGNGPEDRRRTT
jgi:hypothetical protein